MEYITILLSIVMIDLVLAGDNAIVIGLASRNLPKDNQKKAILLGTSGAIILRSFLTIAVAWLLNIPWLLFIGGLAMIWIAYKLLIENKQEKDVDSGQSVWDAVKTIIIADTAMGLDNVLAVAGAAHGNTFLVILGLLISIPIIIWGSKFFIQLIDRFPVIIYIGSGVLAWTASKMIIDEDKLAFIFEGNIVLQYIVKVVIIIGVLLVGWFVKNKKS